MKLFRSFFRKKTVEPSLKKQKENKQEEFYKNIEAQIQSLIKSQNSFESNLNLVCKNIETLKNNTDKIEAELKALKSTQQQSALINKETQVDDVISAIEDIIPKKNRKKAEKRFSKIKQQIQTNHEISFPQKKPEITSPPPTIINFSDALNHQSSTHKPSESTLAPGSCGEHRLQELYETKNRALNFYNKQVLDYLAPKMQEFILEQEFLFIASADKKGECDCTSKFGQPGFIRVLNEKYVIYPEYRGNGVMANLGNITENPHIAMLMIDFQKTTIGLHINGKVRVIENDELLQHKDSLPESIIEEAQKQGYKHPERWVMVEVEEAYIQCSKHIPLMKKLDKRIDWGTDNVAAKGGDFFELLNIPLFNRVGGEQGMEKVVDLFYRKVLQDELVSSFFEDVDMDAQRQKQKAFLSMAFGGPYQYNSIDLRKAHQRLVDDMKMNDEHFDHILNILAETLRELDISEQVIKEMMESLESTREDVLCR